MSHGRDVKDEVFVPAFDENEAVLSVEAAVEFGLAQLEVHRPGGILQGVPAVLDLQILE